MEKTVISLGGSVLVPDEIDEKYLVEASNVIRELSREMHLLIVCGGGMLARRYISAGRNFSQKEYFLDELGIMATRLNAQLLLTSILDIAYPKVPFTTSFASSKSDNYAVVVMGGTRPGHSTDQVAAELAIKSGAKRFINATSVDGVYTGDPKTDPNARLLKNISLNELKKIIGKKKWTRAGDTFVMDPEACRIIKGYDIELIVLNGRDLSSLRNAVEGKSFKGTTIHI
jgi:uridylate kinase